MGRLQSYDTALADGYRQFAEVDAKDAFLPDLSAYVDMALEEKRDELGVTADGVTLDGENVLMADGDLHGSVIVYQEVFADYQPLMMFPVRKETEGIGSIGKGNGPCPAAKYKTPQTTDVADVNEETLWMMEQDAQY